MNTSKSNRSDSTENLKSHVADAAHDLLNEGKKLAGEIYETNAKKVAEAQENLKEYSDQLVDKVRENPVTSVLIAGGIGFLLSALLRNK